MNFTDKDTTCPLCGYVCDKVTDVNVGSARAPRDGDVSICIRCGELSKFKADAPGGLEVILGAELSKVNRDPDIQRARRAWRATVEKKGPIA